MSKKILLFFIVILISCGGGGGGSPTEPEPPAPPTVTNVSFTTDEDTELSFTLSGTESESLPLTFSLTTNPQNGTASLEGANVIYNPNANFNGSDTFNYNASSTNGTSNLGTITITVTPVDDAPSTYDIETTTDEDTSVDITFTYDEVDNDQVTFTVVNNPSNGSVTIANNVATYTPTADWNGTDTFNFEIQDSSSKSIINQATATIVVNAVNDAPVCFSTTASVDYGSTVTINMNCTDIDSSSLTYIISTNPTNGTVSTSSNVASYTPSGFGTDNFQFKANDGELDSNNADVGITINSDEASFTVDVESSNAYAPQRVNFTNTSATALSFLWDFGDGTTSSEENPTHGYTNAGTYTISQSIVGPLNTDTETMEYTVNVIPSSNAVYTDPKYIFQGSTQTITVNINALNLASAEINVLMPAGVEVGTVGWVGTSILTANGVDPLTLLYYTEPAGTDGRDFHVLTSALDQSAMDTTGSGELFSFTFANSNQSDVEIGISVTLLDGSGNELTPGAVIGAFLIESSASKFANEESKYIEKTLPILQNKPEGY
jgi:PKD repeat protein